MDQELEQFIANHIHSIETLEALLLLHRSAGTLWTLEALSQKLSIPQETAARVLRELQRSGLVQSGRTPDSYAFQPDPKNDAQVSALDAAYANRRITVMNAVYAANLTKLRTFANAFKLGGPKE